MHFGVRHIKNSFALPSSRFTALLQITALGLFSGLMITHAAWGLERTYPLSPIIAGFVLPGFVHTGLFYLLLGSLLAVIFTRHFRTVTFLTTLFSLLILITLDITRLQPWILHYAAVMLIGFLSFTHVKNNPQKGLDAAAILIGGIYFWSGLQKINAAFFLEVFPWFTQNLFAAFGTFGITLAGTLGFFVPLFEVGFALGLFTKRFRTISIIGSLSMLFIVLYSLGPWGQSWNDAVWPWNIVICFSVLLIFLHNRDTFATFLARQRRNWLAGIVFILIWIVPTGNLFGLTDHYLAWSLYSGRVPTAALVGNQEFLNSLSERAESGELQFHHWSTSNMHLVPYPEERVFVSIFTQLCRQYPEQDLSLTIDIPRFFISTDSKQEAFICPK